MHQNQESQNPGSDHRLTKSILMLSALCLPTAALYSGCVATDHKEPPTTAAQLDERVTTVLEELREELSNHELTKKEFSNLLYDLTEREGLFTPGFVYDFDDAGELGRLTALFQAKLKTSSVFGLTQDYVVLEHTPQSYSMRQDHARYLAMRNAVQEQLDQAVDEHGIPESQFKEIIATVVAQTDGIPSFGYRDAELRGNMQGTFQWDYTIIPDREYENQAVPAEDLEHALKRVQFQWPASLK